MRRGWLIMTHFAALFGGTAGCGSGASTGGFICVYPVREPKYTHLSTPACSGWARWWGERSCWRVAPEGGGEFVDVSASCGIAAGGELECWKPAVADAPAGRFEVVDDDGWNACAARSSGGVACWGDAPWPAVPDSEVFVALSVGGSGEGEVSGEGISACGLTEAGDIVCWGSGRRHWAGCLRLDGPFVDVELGDGGLLALRADRKLEEYLGAEPVDLGDSGTYRDMTAGRVRCRLSTGGELQCEGGPVYARMEAGPPADLEDVRMIRSGSEHACALEEDGDVRCWGDARPPPDRKFRYISRPDDWDSYCGITLEGQAYCWGDPSPPPVPSDPLAEAAAPATPSTCW